MEHCKAGKLCKVGLFMMFLPGVFYFLFYCIAISLHGESPFISALLVGLMWGGPFLIVAGLTWRYSRIGSLVAITMSLLTLGFLVGYSYADPTPNREYVTVPPIIIFMVGSFLVLISTKYHKDMLKKK